LEAPSTLKGDLKLESNSPVPPDTWRTGKT
jgi:hypothetical protein